MQGPRKKDPAAELRTALIDALMTLPFVDALPNRQMLLTLVRSDVVRFPDVQERPDARLHVVDIVMACLNHPGGLQALRAALSAMAPDAKGTRRVRYLIDSATMSSLLPASQLDSIQGLLARAEQSGIRVPIRTVDARIGPIASADTEALISTFLQLAEQRSGQDEVPPALSFVEHIAWQVDSGLAADLKLWTDAQAEWLGVLAELRALRDRLATDAVDEIGDGKSAAREQEASTDIESEPAAARDELSSEPSGGGCVAAPDPKGATDLAVLSPSLTGENDGHIGEDEMPPPVPAAPTDVARLPQVWGNVPLRNPDFTGRESLLRDLHDQLAVQRETAVLPQALHGMGGVGKSQVAIEYVHRYRAAYDLIWWIPAEQPGQVLSALTDLAKSLELDVSDAANSAVPAVREALSTGKAGYDNWLLVFDNAEVLDVRQYFPSGGNGKILVTSRNPEWSRVARSLEVDVFTRTESMSFLMRRTPELAEVDADRLADALGDLPLAVEQAAAWRVATGMPVDEYLRLLADKRMELLGEGSSPDYQLSVAAAWNVSLDKLKQVNDAALQLLQVCSFFAPEPISRELFAGSPSSPITDSLDRTLSDPIKLARAIRDIQRYALAKFDHRPGALQMHRLVQAVLVGRMEPSEREVMRRGAHTLLANANPNKPAAPGTWPLYRALRPHVAVSRATESDDPRVRQLVFHMIEFLYYWGDHEGCLELAAQVHDLRKADLGEDHEYTLAVAKWRSWILVVLGRFEEARQINVRSLELSRAAFGETDEGTLDAVTRVAIDLRVAGDFIGALALDRRVVEVCRREFSEDDPATLRAASHLGVSLRQMGAFAEARELDADTYRRQSLILGETDDATMRTLNNLTMDQREAGDYIGARLRQEEAYELFLKVFGPENPAVTRAARNLAVARRKAGDHDSARKLAEDTLNRFRIRYGDLYPDTMAAALNLAVDLRQTGDLDGARELGEQTLKRYIQVFGEPHPHTLSARANLAIVLRLQGEVANAYESDRETLEILHATLGPDHPTTLTVATNLASDLYALDDRQGAYERDVDTLERSRRALGEDHPSTLACGQNLSLDLKMLGRDQEADKIHADVMVRYRRVLGDRHPATLNARESIRADCDIDPLPW